MRLFVCKWFQREKVTWCKVNRGREVIKWHCLRGKNDGEKNFLSKGAKRKNAKWNFFLKFEWKIGQLPATVDGRLLFSLIFVVVFVWAYWNVIDILTRKLKMIQKNNKNYCRNMEMECTESTANNTKMESGRKWINELLWINKRRNV